MLIARHTLGKFYAQVLRYTEIGELTLFTSRYDPHTFMPSHTHEVAQFYLFYRGGTREAFGQGARECITSTVYYHPPGIAHSSRLYASGADDFSLHVEPAYLARYFQHTGIRWDEPHEFHQALPVQLMRRLNNELRRMDALSPLTIQGLCLEMVAEIARCRVHPAEKRPLWLRHAEELIRDCFSTNLSIDEIAKAAGVHPAHLTRVFRRYFGCTVGEYLRKVRIEFACREIQTSGATLSEIAATAGFADQSHLNRVFKRQFGMTPREYKRQFTGSEDT